MFLCASSHNLRIRFPKSDTIDFDYIPLTAIVLLPIFFPCPSTMSNNQSNNMEHRSGVDKLAQDFSGTGITRNLSQSLKRPAPGLAKLGYGDAGPSLENVHSIFAAGLERRRRAAALNLGYESKGPDDDEAEPTRKKRRFQRRNSKTPAMLFKSMNILSQDLFEDTKPSEPWRTIPETHGRPESKQDDDADWDSGLEIAEEIVKHLQKRRLSDVSASS